jgi:hypothetical protein
MGLLLAKSGRQGSSHMDWFSFGGHVTAAITIHLSDIFEDLGMPGDDVHSGISDNDVLNSWPEPTPSAIVSSLDWGWIP